MNDIPDPAYLETYFSAEPPPEGYPLRFGVVTGFDAEGRPQPREADRKADAELGRYLAEAGLAHFRVTGRSRDGSHSEPGFGIRADSPEDIRPISRRFRQKAFFWIEEGTVFLANTDGKMLHRVDAWAARLLPGGYGENADLGLS